ncbi:MAG: hypothetical protein WD426_11090 [Anditalea sp.]
MTDNKEIGIINSLTQLVALGIFSGGAIFFLPLALAEITGWVMLGLWIGLNFFGLPLIIKLTDKILLTGLSGGLLAYILNLTYYRFHMYYIDKEFNLNDYKSDLIPIVLTMTVAIMIGELIRRKRKALAANN